MFLCLIYVAIFLLLAGHFPVVFCVPCSGWWEQSVFQFCFHIDWYASLMPHIEPLSITLIQKRKRKKKRSLMSAWRFPHGWKLSVTHFAQYCKKCTFWGLLMDFQEQNLDYFSLFTHMVYTGANTPSTETLRVKREQKRTQTIWTHNMRSLIPSMHGSICRNEWRGFKWFTGLNEICFSI